MPNADTSRYYTDSKGRKQRRKLKIFEEPERPYQSYYLSPERQPRGRDSFFNRDRLNATYDPRHNPQHPQQHGSQKVAKRAPQEATP